MINSPNQFGSIRVEMKCFWANLGEGTQKFEPAQNPTLLTGRHFALTRCLAGRMDATGGFVSRLRTEAHYSKFCLMVVCRLQFKSILDIGNKMGVLALRLDLLVCTPLLADNGHLYNLVFLNMLKRYMHSSLRWGDFVQ